MTANTGTVLQSPAWRPGESCTSLGTVTFSGSATTADTGTIAGMLPSVNGYKVTDFEIWGNKLDTHVTAPTATLKAGDGTDDDFYVAGLAGNYDAAAQQLLIKGTGVGIGTGTTAASTSVVLTLGGTVATAGSGAVLFVKITYNCFNAEN